MLDFTTHKDCEKCEKELGDRNTNVQSLLNVCKDPLTSIR